MKNIRQNDFPYKVILAPMAGITDAPFRLICKEMGADLTVSEMISSYGIKYKNKLTLSYFAKFDKEIPASFQIFGSDPEIMAQAAKFAEHSGASIVDINMGCSVPKVLKSGSGSALINDLTTVKKIVKSVVESVSIPISVKIRIPQNNNSLNGNKHSNLINLAKTIEENGASFITLHGRTPAQAFRGEADWQSISIIKQNISIPVVGNGDITSAEKAVKMLKITGCDAVMIGRAALGNPWIFRKIKNLLNGVSQEDKVSTSEKRNIAKYHFELLLKTQDEERALVKMKKFLCWYSKGSRSSARLRQKLFAQTSVESLMKIINSELE